MRRGFNSILRSKANTCGGIYTANEVALYLENYINCKSSKNLTIIINILAFKIARRIKWENLGHKILPKKRVVIVVCFCQAVENCSHWIFFVEFTLCLSCDLTNRMARKLPNGFLRKR